MKNRFTMSSVFSRILLFARGDRLACELKKTVPDQVILIKPALFFKQLGPSIYQINPDESDDYKMLFRSMETGSLEVAGIVHLWNLECEGVDFVYGGLKKTVRALRQN